MPIGSWAVGGSLKLEWNSASSGTLRCQIVVPVYPCVVRQTSRFVSFGLGHGPAGAVGQLQTHVPTANIIIKGSRQIELPVLHRFTSLRVPEQIIAVRSEGTAYEIGGSPKCHHRDEVLNTEPLVKQCAYEVDVLLTNLHEDASHVGEKILGNN